MKEKEKKLIKKRFSVKIHILIDNLCSDKQPGLEQEQTLIFENDNECFDLNMVVAKALE